MMTRVARCWKWFISLAAVLAGMTFAVEQAGAFPSADGASDPDDPNAEPTLSLTPQGAFQLNNDATLRRCLREARARLEAKQVADGLTLLQRILDRGDDGFVRLRSDGPPLEVRLQALRMLSALPADARTVYEKLYGTQARQLFER
ncbi:MAG TPA: hypothetical protein VK137_19115, partial [Planctomycetaceae bacterium]|nr:hypothetical protein [Planctomycetaceae bacterium]